MAITGLHHVLLTVLDLQRSASFYEDLLGLRKIKDIPDDGVAGAKVLFALPDGRLVGLVQHQATSDQPFDETHAGLDHLAFGVSQSELPEWEQRLDQAGVEYSRRRRRRSVTPSSSCVTQTGSSCRSTESSRPNEACAPLHLPVQTRS